MKRKEHIIVNAKQRINKMGGLRTRLGSLDFLKYIHTIFPTLQGARIASSRPSTSPSKAPVQNCTKAQPTWNWADDLPCNGSHDFSRSNRKWAAAHHCPWGKWFTGLWQFHVPVWQPNHNWTARSCRRRCTWFMGRTTYPSCLSCPWAATQRKPAEVLVRWLQKNCKKPD